MFCLGVSKLKMYILKYCDSTVDLYGIEVCHTLSERTQIEGVSLNAEEHIWS
jgi:hypothetical protein